MRLPRVTIRRLMIVIAIVAVLMTAGERAWRHYLEQNAARARLLIKQKLIRTLGPAAAPQGDW
jgi:Tfp pilus assembly protein PilE